jgi:hypothetical protein
MAVLVASASNGCASNHEVLPTAVMAAGVAMSALWPRVLCGLWQTFATNNYFELKMARLGEVD